ncbi:helix-turn-helix domain-containing protein [Paraburkholderia graminis]|jgi:transcriptional regulator with XRE-family HTH domain|uniref:Transcriptional regulator with XRE-family HTH domain n=1 Tax=Paraburkholderia graminis TaxID=60548 RepID=A0ABD5CPY3_9BURK|nr:helix-turn-helix domain-containing protein [Paraburkholderia graminis]MDR6207287.1 transcriptional regulator with XRE-family HTH domain [Paraburkholderia graminis]
MENLTSLGERLRFVRALRRTTQAELAEAVGLSQPMIKKIESGSETSRVVDLAAALRVRPQWLAKGDEPMEEVEKESTSAATKQEPGALEKAVWRLMRATVGLPAEQTKQLAAAVELLRSASAVSTAAVAPLRPTGP